MNYRSLITCEHAVNTAPPPFKKYFIGREGLLKSHKGYDEGALTLARRLARALGCPLHCAAVTRLLVDCNRSCGNRNLFTMVPPLPEGARRTLLERYYDPYRAKAEADIARLAEGGFAALHLSVHSFTGAPEGVARNADAGLLYDPARRAEARFCASLARALKTASPGLRVRRNYPYRGVSDGFTSYLRRQFPASRYLGIEIELNQEYLARCGRKAADLLAGALLSVLKG